MTTHKKRTRMGVAVATALLSMASVFALASPASADINTPGQPQNVVASGGQNTIKVTWTPPVSGGTVDNYVIYVSPAGQASPLPFSYEKIQPASDPKEYTFTGVAPGTYQVNVFAQNNAAAPALGPPAQVTPVVVTGPTQVENTDPFRPYSSWEAMITAEYKMFTGCGVGGRAPRLDELTFWRYNLEDRPFDGSEFYELSNNPGTFYTKRYTFLVTDPDGAGPARAPADNNPADGVISPAEQVAASALATNQATNDVKFNRRKSFAAYLGEEAMQTDGPAIRLYTAYFARDVDMGACFWSKRMRSGKSLLSISEFFVQSAEFEKLYGKYVTNSEEPGMDAAEFVGLIYKNVLNRTPDGSGFSFWTRQLQSQRKSPAEVMIGFSESAEFKNKRQLSTGIAVAYIHMTGRTPTASEYIQANIAGRYFDTSPECGWSAFGCTGNSLYTYLVGTADYKTWSGKVG